MQIPGPDTRVVELRVHGILGTTGHRLVDAVASVDVAGDGIGRIVRPADRLRRPVPGPMLTAGDRTVPRIVEGYVWGAMTSGGIAKATWALLFPFALANVTHWMLPSPKADNIVSRATSAVLRAVLRLAALMLTMLFVAQLTVVSLDLVAAQCLRPGSQCMAFVPDAVRDATVARTALALLPIALILLLMYRLSSVSWRVAPGKVDTPHNSAQAPVLPGNTVVSDPDTPRLRALHIVAALSTVVFLALGGPTAPSDPRWFLAAALIVAAAGLTVFVDDPNGMRSPDAASLLRVVLGPVPRHVLITISALLLVSVVVLPPRLHGPLTGSGPTIDLLTLLMLMACVAVAVFLVPAALFGRASWKKQPNQLRPWAGGWFAAPILMIACLLGDGFGAGLALSVRQALRDPSLQLPAAYDDVTVFWGATAVLLAAALLVVVPIMLIDQWRTARSEEAVPAQVALLHAGRQQDQRRAASAWRWADLQRRYSHRILLVVAGVLAASTIVSIVLRITGITSREAASPLVGVGVAALAALAASLLRVVYLAATERKTARYVGVFCDLALFWPREAHPVVPPCYALKVVPELAARAAEHLADPDTRVVIVGHSQGSLLAAVATSRLLESLPEADRERVGLVTAGSQLQWAYPRAFPGAVPHDSLRDLAGTLGGRWRSLCRGTDPIGGAVSTWNRQIYDNMLIGVGFRADGTEGPLPVAARGPTGALVLGGDHWLPDPQRGPFSFRRWVPGVLAHSDYSGDPEWDRAVAMAAGLEIPVRGAVLPLSATAPLAQRAAEAQALQAQGGDGESLDAQPDSWNTEDAEELEGTVELAQSDGDDATERLKHNSGRKASSLDLDELSEPRGRTAPWERAFVVRASDH